jgi:hypothetical protein
MGDRQQVSGVAVLGGAIGGLLGVLGTRVAYLIKDPADHKIVCQCSCMGPANESGMRWGSEQNFDERENCGTLNGVNCTRSDGTAGELGYCEKKSVETRLIGERVRGQRLFVKDEG